MSKNLPQRAGALLEALRERRPLVHHLTNMVVMNFTANVTLALGASPVMAPCSEEVEEMVSLAGALLLNIGTLDPPLVESMIRAGRKAAELDVPVVLDPVGAGATRLRTEAAARILREVPVRVLRGNAGEVLTLAGREGRVQGVDSLETAEGREEVLAAFARDRNLTLAVTGPVDFLTDGTRRIRVHGGHPLMARVTGTGCAATTATACFLAVAPQAPLEAAAAALAAFGLAGERAASRSAGPGTFVPHLLDALADLERSDLEEEARLEAVS